MLPPVPTCANITLPCAVPEYLPQNWSSATLGLAAAYPIVTDNCGAFLQSFRHPVRPRLQRPAGPQRPHSARLDGCGRQRQCRVVRPEQHPAARTRCRRLFETPSAPAPTQIPTRRLPANHTWRLLAEISLVCRRYRLRTEHRFSGSDFAALRRCLQRAPYLEPRSMTACRAGRTIPANTSRLLPCRTRPGRYFFSARKTPWRPPSVCVQPHV